MDKIESYIENYTFEDFISDSKTVDAVIRNFEIIGEAAKHLPQELKDRHAQLPWKEMYLLRNRISHEYFGVDLEIIWNIITQHLSVNRAQIRGILKKEGYT